MTDNRMQPNANVRPAPNVNDFLEDANPEQVDEQSQQSQANAAAQPGKRAAPPRMPLFRH
jgi:hypothetical protein